MKKIFAGFFDIIEFFVSSSAVAIMIYIFVTQPHQVSGNSMYPNFHDGEFLLTDKVSYNIGEPKRGDVVIFSAPPAAHCPVGLNCDFIKRVVGMPGERIKIQNGKVYVNSQILTEPYESAIKITNSGSQTTSYLSEGREQLIPDGSYIVFGDNRPGSSDSREWGPIEKKRIIGKVWLRYWPPNVAGLLSFDKATLE